MFDPARNPRATYVPRILTEHAEMATYLGLFAALERALPARTLLPLPARIAAHLPRAPGDAPTETDRDRALLLRARRLALRLGRFVPGTRCLHRALAARLWLARRDVTAVTLVLGLRRDAAPGTEPSSLTGHAWIERKTDDGSITTIFLEGHPKYTPILRENTVETTSARASSPAHRAR